MKDYGRLYFDVDMKIYTIHLVLNLKQTSVARRHAPFYQRHALFPNALPL